MSISRTRYLTGLTDSARWDVIDLRDGDIIISTPSKCGTTWMQMICALLVFQDPALPAPLTVLSPWVDMRLRPVQQLKAQLDGQVHRRFMKTHTPLDGLPRHPGVTYVVVGRDPRDVAVSMAHHRANLNGDVVGGALVTMGQRPELADRITGWIEDERPPDQNLSSLTGTAWHLRDAWQRRLDPQVVLVHYADLSANLAAEMHRLASVLGAVVPDSLWPSLVGAATFDGMRERAGDLAPDEAMGLFLDRDAFFRAGRSRQWEESLTPADLAVYDRRLAGLAPPDLIAWLHRGWRETGPVPSPPAG